MKKNLTILASAIILFLISCGEKPSAVVKPDFNLDSVKAEIAASNKSYGESIAKKDSVAFRDHYASDGCIFNSNMPRLCGTPGILGFFNAALGMGISSLNLNTEEVLGGPSTVSEVGNYELKIANGTVVDKGKYVVVWKTENGKWKMYKDIFNSDNPPPPPPPANK
jgi:ketosteroid isomerase-like protein